MRIRPADMRFESAPMARGHGVFASELDAAFEDILQDVPAENRRALKQQVSDGWRGVRDDGEPVEASGATDFTGEDTKQNRDVIVPIGRLYEVAMLVTGRWGRLALPSKNERSVGPSGDVYQRRRRVSVFRDGSGPSEMLSFRERLDKLELLLSERRDAAMKSYRSRAKKKVSFVPDARARKSLTNWVGAFSTMLDGVRFVKRQLERSPKDRTIFGLTSSGRALPLGIRWGVLAGDGNSKLPFLAYSELPMSTCPGAGECGVYKRDASTGTIASGWCYSFKAWRYPAAFARQFLNTLAATSSRMFEIEKHSGDGSGGIQYWSDVDGGFQNLEREWQQYVKVLVLRKAASLTKTHLRKGRKSLRDPKRPADGGRVVFFRLFVDGDMGDADTVAAWMTAVRQMGDLSERDEAMGKRVLSGELGAIQVYGYSKAWGEFVYADQRLGRAFWPDNYVLNLSNASIYAGSETEKMILRLPITRGYFNAIDFRSQLRSIKKLEPSELSLPEQPPLPGVTLDQMRGIVELGEVRSFEDAERLLAARFGVEVHGDEFRQLDAPADWPENQEEASAARSEYERERVALLRGQVLHRALSAMLGDEQISLAVREEIARDEGFHSLKAAEKFYASKKRKNAPTSSVKGQQKKLVALLVHSIFAAARRSSSGSCPLICGNCSDMSLTSAERAIAFSSQKSFEDFQALTGAVHRCASKVPTLGYVPPAGKTLPKNVELVRSGPEAGTARGYRRLPNGRVELSVGYYGSDVHIGLH